METSPLICFSNQWTDFYTIETSVMKELIAWGPQDLPKYMETRNTKITFFLNFVLDSPIFCCRSLMKETEIVKYTMDFWSIGKITTYTYLSSYAGQNILFMITVCLVVYFYWFILFDITYVCSFLIIYKRILPEIFLAMIDFLKNFLSKSIKKASKIQLRSSFIMFKRSSVLQI